MSHRSVRAATATFVRERMVRRLLPDPVVSNLNRNDRVGALYRAWGLVFTNHLEGGYYEFGVYRGDAFRASHRVYAIFADWMQGQLEASELWRRPMAARYATYRHEFYAFDTFQGLPANQEGNQIFAEGNFSCSLEEFSRLNRAAGIVEGERVRYFVGLFSEVAQRQASVLASLQPAAIVNLDCDLYESAKDALEVIAPKLTQGSVFLVDDWNTFCARRDQGERRAITEFLARHPEWSFEPWFPYEYSGQSFIVHQQDQPAESTCSGER